MYTLEQRVLGTLKFIRDKHDLGADYVENTVHCMDNMEFLELLSLHLEDMFDEHKQEMSR